MIIVADTIRARGIITPCEERTVAHGMTYGLGYAGYDIRIEFSNLENDNERTLHPGQFTLASTIEEFNMPKDILGIVHDKSTWARKGLAVQNTVIEPGWRGFLTLELTNHGNYPLNLLRGMPIAQVIFHRLEAITPGYKGKYQDQDRGPQEPLHEK
jgi:dCTP deaminase